jgi:hypothetical protein
MTLDVCRGEDDSIFVSFCGILHTTDHPNHAISAKTNFCATIPALQEGRRKNVWGKVRFTGAADTCRNLPNILCACLGVVEDF